ncbi:MAG: trigger factor [Chlamydiales bacterium]|nr:trigger factor [Chlamydiales bacterium]
MKTFENDSFSVEANEESGCLLSLKIQVRPEAAKKAYKKAVKIVNKQISIPGFRKGRAPDATVISKYGSYVEQEWKEILVNDAYRAALDLTEIYPLSKESIKRPKIESCSQEEGAVVTLSYEYYPNIPEIDFSGISLPEIAKEAINEEQVNEIIEEVRRSNADWEEISGRAVEEGDYVDVSIDAIDVDPPSSIVKDRRFEVAEKRLAPWMLKLLIGMNISDSVEGMSEVDEKADEATKKKFKPTHVRITLHGIKKIILPELTDELAKKVGADSVDDMKTKIRSNLEREAEDQQHQKRIEALEKALLEKYSFDLPASLVENERVDRIRSRIEELKERGERDEEIKEQEQQIESDVAKEVEESLRLFFLNKQIIRQGNISLSHQELNDELVKQIGLNPYLYGRDIDKESSKEIMNRMAASLMQRKAKDYALEQVMASR